MDDDMKGKNPKYAGIAILIVFSVGFLLAIGWKTGLAKASVAVMRE